MSINYSIEYKMYGRLSGYWLLKFRTFLGIRITRKKPMVIVILNDKLFPHLKNNCGIKKVTVKI